MPIGLLHHLQNATLLAFSYCSIGLCYRKYHNAFQKTAARINSAIAEAITRWQVLDPPLLQYFVDEIHHTHPIISRICKGGGYPIDSCVRSFDS
ncbi:hypothetical protein TNIN_391321 [Trichonephila inaurata madagascariensis]|uniref:Uncharacterized protein n=1 Tax=Trichonephila inaurata madagascariensis TaxID=2747483 RepID=A0A8X6XPP4_9ARAC|nr:hypothetical protein TNIN_391321 [Trichonephila inaurata madagascariensis]